MSDKIIAIKIDVTKIDKNRLFPGKNGRKYLDAVLFLNEEADQYGQNGMITQSVSKEERESGVKGAILGNVKVIRGGNSNSHPNQPSQAARVVPANNVAPQDDDLPF